MLSAFLFKPKKLSWAALFLLIMLLGAFYFRVGAGGRSDVGTIEFIVEKGMGLKEIADQLKREGLINSVGWFKMYSLTTGVAHRFKPGFYELNGGLSSSQIAKILSNGPQDIVVTIPEGATLVDIDARISEAKVISAGELINFDWRGLEDRFPFLKGVSSLEGFLFPDTYKLARFSSPEEVVIKFLTNFEREVSSQLREDNSFYEKLILASLVEKEALHPQDRLLVAGVLKRRLTIGMALQVDAALVYAKCRGAFLSCDADTRKLSRADLREVAGPYNNYLNVGLPPTPIASPGLGSIMAAFNPKDSKYLYYISNPKTGRIIFAETLDDHNENRFKYLRG